jgi:hypothetical protein
MTAYTGKNLYLLWNGTSIESDYRSFDPTEEMGTDDASAGSDAAVTRKTTLKDGNASLTMRSISGTAGTALWATTMAVGTEGTLEWGPEGTATGEKRAYVNAILTSRSESNAYANVVEWTFDWEYSGEVTYTTY